MLRDKIHIDKLHNKLKSVAVKLDFQIRISFIFKDEIIYPTSTVVYVHEYIGWRVLQRPCSPSTTDQICSARRDVARLFTNRP